MFRDNMPSITDYILESSRPGQICLSRNSYRMGDVVQTQVGNLTIESLSKVMGTLCFYNLTDKHSSIPENLIGSRVIVILHA